MAVMRRSDAVLLALGARLESSAPPKPAAVGSSLLDGWISARVRLAADKR